MFYFRHRKYAFFWLFLSVALVWALLLTYSAVLLEETSYSRYKGWKDLLKMFAAGFLENFGYRQLHSFWRFKGTLKYIFRTKSGWGTIKRAKI